MLLVPKTGFEPAHPCERCDLNTVRLPISPLGHQVAGREGKTIIFTFKKNGERIYKNLCCSNIIAHHQPIRMVATIIKKGFISIGKNGGLHQAIY
jgi:hypothetical protein